MEEYRLEIFKKASFCRHFENNTYKYVQEGKVKIPVYLSAGQEFIPATIFTFFDEKKIDTNLFIQHRGHSQYLCKGGDPKELIRDLLGKTTTSPKGMVGSASIQSINANIYGHDGLMGSQVPIGVGHCYQTKKPTVITMGDASAEEDYVLGALGWASTKNLPILFVVEDNNLSILTEKNIRRNWEIHDVSEGMKIKSVNITDHPIDILSVLFDYNFEYPMLLNINTVRKYWHSGAGKDDDNFDRYLTEKKFFGSLGDNIDSEIGEKVKNLWLEQLETL